MTINEFLNKWKEEWEGINIGHFSINGDFTLNLDDICIDKYDLNKFKKMINDFENNFKNWEKLENCNSCGNIIWEENK
ncbi:hypothetical protein [Spiroplasma endosymbiont of Danaus chrysippus]|uniref:hypothetical protein n=1 Tax=Spiroplasma endosymbiont of Danaus chrysippus TaxID=2691041 RepID=UPI00157A31BB|nr:hypothetical protein [Spiroplasma endosymbiont of Danaus chrysippus]